MTKEAGATYSRKREERFTVDGFKCISVHELTTRLAQRGQIVHAGYVVDETHIADVQYSFQVVRYGSLQLHKTITICET